MAWDGMGVCQVYSGCLLWWREGVLPLDAQPWFRLLRDRKTAAMPLVHAEFVLRSHRPFLQQSFSMGCMYVGERTFALQYVRQG